MLFKGREVVNFYCLIIERIKRYVFNISLFGVLYSIMFTTGCCIPLRRDRVADLMDELSQLHIQYEELQQNYADLYAKFNSEHAKFEALIQDLQDKVSALEEREKAYLIAKDEKSKEDYDEFDSPLSIYRQAYADYSAAKYDLAYHGFKSFIDKYPNEPLVSDARLYMAKSFEMSEKDMP